MPSIGESELLRTKYIKTLEVLSDNQREIQTEQQANSELKKRIVILVRKVVYFYVYITHIDVCLVCQEAQLSETNFGLLNAQIDQLKSQNAELTAQLDVLNKEHRDKLQHLSMTATHSNNKELQRMAHKLQESESTRDRTHRHFVELQAKHDELSSKYDELLNRTRAESGSRSELEHKCMVLSETKRALEAENLAMTERMVKLESKLATLQSHLKGLQERANSTASVSDQLRDLENKLNGYVRLYADTQSENEKLKLDVKRLEAALETEKAMLENRMGKEMRRLKTALQESEENNAALVAENNRLKEYFLQQQNKPASESKFGGFVDLKRENDDLKSEIARLKEMLQARPQPQAPAPVAAQPVVQASSAPPETTSQFGKFVDLKRENQELRQQLATGSGMLKGNTLPPPRR
jgi:chromosome segregation ATPase